MIKEKKQQKQEIKTGAQLMCHEPAGWTPLSAAGKLRFLSLTSWAPDPTGSPPHGALLSLPPRGSWQSAQSGVTAAATRPWSRHIGKSGCQPPPESVGLQPLMGRTSARLLERRRVGDRRRRQLTESTMDGLSSFTT